MVTPDYATVKNVTIFDLSQLIYDLESYIQIDYLSICWGKYIYQNFFSYFIINLLFNPLDRILKTSMIHSLYTLHSCEYISGLIHVEIFFRTSMEYDSFFLSNSRGFTPQVNIHRLSRKLENSAEKWKTETPGWDFTTAMMKCRLGVILTSSCYKLHQIFLSDTISIDWRTGRFFSSFYRMRV